MTKLEGSIKGHAGISLKFKGDLVSGTEVFTQMPEPFNLISR